MILLYMYSLVSIFVFKGWLNYIFSLNGWLSRFLTLAADQRQT